MDETRVQQAEAVEVKMAEAAESAVKSSSEATVEENATEGGEEERSMDFESEMNYAAAREIMNSLLKQSLLTGEEVDEIDEFLQQQFSPIFVPLVAKYPAF